MITRFLVLLGLALSANGQLLDALFGNDCLKKVVPNGMCAVLYDDDGCEGWEEPVPMGYTALGLFRKNDAEAVVVKKGCILTGWDHADENEAKRGEKAVFDGRNFDKAYNYWKNLDGRSLEDEISAVTCECPGSGSGSSSGGSSSSPSKTDPSSNTRPGACPPVPKTACAVLYDDKNCENDDFKGLVLNPGEERSFSLLRSPLNAKYKNEIESFSVRDGCTLEAFDDSNFSDDAIRAKAKGGDLHVNLDDHPNRKFEDLDSDIESVRCNC